MLSSLPCFYASMLFADLLSLHLVTFFNVFYSCSCHFFSSRCMLELKFVIYYRATSSPSQASYAVLAEESQAFFKHSSHTGTNSISNLAILCNNYILLLSDLCACVHVKKKWRRKGSHSSSVSGSNRLVWLQIWQKAMGWCTAQWKIQLFCAKTIVKKSLKNWTSPSEEEVTLLVYRGKIPHHSQERATKIMTTPLWSLSCSDTNV